MLHHVHRYECQEILVNEGSRTHTTYCIDQLIIIIIIIVVVVVIIVIVVVVIAMVVVII